MTSEMISVLISAISLIDTTKYTKIITIVRCFCEEISAVCPRNVQLILNCAL